MIFSEQEITGDVLLEIDVNVLKTEIGIVAYGKRVRIANAIAELRRPTSFEFPMPPTMLEHPPHEHTQTGFQTALNDTANETLAPVAHTRTQSHSQQSHHSFPGISMSTQLTHRYTQSTHSSVGSPASYGFVQQQQQQSNENGTIPSQVSSKTNQQAGSSTSVGLGINLSSNEVCIVLFCDVIPLL